MDLDKRGACVYSATNALVGKKITYYKHSRVFGYEEDKQQRQKLSIKGQSFMSHTSTGKAEETALVRGMSLINTDINGELVHVYGTAGGPVAGETRIWELLKNNLGTPAMQHESSEVFARAAFALK